MISAKNITKLYGQQKALEDVSFEAQKGKILGLLGPNGAGKSTLIKIMTGYIKADSGEVNICERKMDVNKSSMQHLIGYLPEHNPLYLEMYVKEYLNYAAGIYKVNPSVVDKLIDKVGLSAEKHKKIKQLSKGFRQRVGLAQALVHDPEVLILDEPTTGLDPNQIVEVRDLIKAIAKEKTVILSTHLMQEVKSICDEVLIINKGKVVANDSVENILNSSKASQKIEIEFLQDVDHKALKDATDHITKTSKLGDKKVLLELNTSDDLRAEIAEYAAKQGWTILMMQRRESKLEDIFAQLTQ